MGKVHSVSIVFVNLSTRELPADLYSIIDTEWERWEMRVCELMRVVLI